MESALAWLGRVAEWVGQFFPRWVIVHVWEKGIRLKRGRNPVVCDAGIHFWWPVMTTMIVHPITRQTHNLKSQTITTKDDKTIIIGGLIVFEIKDVIKLVVETHDPDDAIKDMSLSAIHDVCCLLAWDELKEQQRNGDLERKLKAAAKSELEKYGVRLLKMTLTDLATARVYKLVQATSTD